MKKILVFDPGENTGWVFRDKDGHIKAGTSVRSHTEVAALISTYKPDIVIFERFNLYPAMAKTMSWNSFYPVEVIGVIRFMCERNNIHYVEQAPSVKKFAGPWNDARWERHIGKDNPQTVHAHDAYQHLLYYERRQEHGTVVKPIS